MLTTWISCFESVLWADFHDNDIVDDAVVDSNIPAHASKAVMHYYVTV